MDKLKKQKVDMIRLENQLIICMKLPNKINKIKKLIILIQEMTKIHMVSRNHKKFRESLYMILAINKKLYNQ